MAPFYDRHVIKTDENKYRCGVCQKLFRGAEFVHKHLNKKHEADVETAANTCFQGTATTLSSWRLRRFHPSEL
jgi:hypothetical protein